MSNQVHFSHFIDGQWVVGNGSSFSSINPATSETIWKGHAANKDDVHSAVESAEKGFKKWFRLSFNDRVDYLENFKSVLSDQHDFIAEAISLDTGKPYWESQAEVAAMIAKIPITIEAYQKRCATMEFSNAHSTIVTRHRPHGVVAVFSPFNFPGHLPNGHIIPALLSGNTVVLKGSELTPFATEAIMKCWQKIHLPDGVLNLVQGGAETGHFLAVHPKIDGLFFTGSYATGKTLSDIFVHHPEKILALEMGGNNPLVVSTISNVEAAAYMTLQSAFITSGQRCSCARRLIITKSKESDHFLETLLKMIRTIQIGNFRNRPEPFMGPVISIGAMDRILTAQATLGVEGGIPLIEMRSLKPGTALLSPGIMDVTKISHRKDEEIFGPFLQIIHVNSFEEAIAEANHTGYGLTAGLLSDKKSEFMHFLEEIKAGIINWNQPLIGSSSRAPFGGIKKSGNHKPSGYYAVDYCSYPIASMESATLELPKTFSPGIQYWSKET